MIPFYIVAIFDMATPTYPTYYEIALPVSIESNYNAKTELTDNKIVVQDGATWYLRIYPLNITPSNGSIGTSGEIYAASSTKIMRSSIVLGTSVEVSLGHLAAYHALVDLAQSDPPLTLRDYCNPEYADAGSFTTRSVRIRMPILAGRTLLDSATGILTGPTRFEWTELAARYTV